MIPRGPRTAALSQAEIKFLREYRYQHGLSVYSLPTAMGAPCKWKTMQKALDGKPITERFHHFIVTWIAEHQVVKAALAAAAVDGKSAGAGERAE